MPALLTSSSVMMCPHGGTVQAISSNLQAKAGGDFLLRASDTFLIVGCPFIVVLPHPCVQVRWVQAATQSKAAGDFTLTDASAGLCIAPDQAVQGTVIVAATQPRVTGR